MEASSSTRRTDTSVSNAASADASGSSSGIVGPSASSEWPLDPDEYLRYGRQMIMPEWGLSGELFLLPVSR